MMILGVSHRFLFLFLFFPFPDNWSCFFVCHDNRKKFEAEIDELDTVLQAQLKDNKDLKRTIDKLQDEAAELADSLAREKGEAGTSYYHGHR